MTAGVRSSWFGLTVLFAVAACQGNQRTELVVEVDSNLAVPSQMDSVQVAVKGNTQSKSCSLINDCKLPWDVGIVEARAGAGTIEIVATGYSGTEAIVNQTADVNFVEGKSMLLRLFLARECIDNTCDQSGQTCGTDGNCRNKARSPSDLKPYTPGASGGAGSSGASNPDGSFDSGGSGDAWAADAPDGQPDVPVSGTGGVAGTGGTRSTGGTTSTGGTATGGAATGGTSIGGGTTSAGGTMTSGGTTSAGGTPTAGGTIASGGTTSAGGTPTAGGTIASGGTTSAGGTPTAGGTVASGGTTNAGGIITAGGTIASDAAAGGTIASDAASTECTAPLTRCSGDGMQTCGNDGKWGVTTTCPSHVCALRQCAPQNRILVLDTSALFEYDATNGAFFGSFAFNETALEGATFGPDGKLWVADGRTHAIARYDDLSGESLGVFAYTPDAPLTPSFGPDQNLYVGLLSGSILRYVMTTGVYSTFASTYLADTVFAGMQFHGAYLFATFVTVTTSDGGSLYQFDAVTGAKIKVIVDNLQSSGPRSPAFDAAGNIYVPIWQSDNVAMFDGQTLAFVKNISQSGLTPGAVTFQPDGKMLIASDRLNGSSYVTRYDPQTATFNGVVGPGSGGLNRAFGIFYR